MLFKLGLVSVFVLAVLVGTLAGRAQTKTSALPPPTLLPTAIPTPAAAHVDIVTSGKQSPPAVYLPTLLTVRAGQTVTWTNKSSGDHSATANSGSFDSGALSPGETYTWTPKAAGTYSYSDIFYPDIAGAIDVRP